MFPRFRFCFFSLEVGVTFGSPRTPPGFSFHPQGWGLGSLQALLPWLPHSIPIPMAGPTEAPLSQAHISLWHHRGGDSAAGKQPENFSNNISHASSRNCFVNSFWVWVTLAGVFHFLFMLILKCRLLWDAKQTLFGLVLGLLPDALAGGDSHHSGPLRVEQ